MVEVSVSDELAPNTDLRGGRRSGTACFAMFPQYLLFGSTACSLRSGESSTSPREEQGGIQRKPSPLRCFPCLVKIINDEDMRDCTASDAPADIIPASSPATRETGAGSPVSASRDSLYKACELGEWTDGSVFSNVPACSSALPKTSRPPACTNPRYISR